MFKYSMQGGYNHIISDLKDLKDMDVQSLLERYGKIGVKKLAANTPVQSGELADAWGYYIEPTNKGQKLVFYNTKTHNGYKVAILVINGHVTKDGGWVEGNDFVSPIINDMCDEIKSEL